MRVITDSLAVTLLGLAAILTLGCDDSREPEPPSAPAAAAKGAIEITVSTEGADIDVDPDGYTVTINAGLNTNGGSSRVVDANTTVTVGALRRGSYRVRLDGLAPNCNVSGTNPRWVEVVTDESISTVTFVVLCFDKSSAGAWDY